LLRAASFSFFAEKAEKVQGLFSSSLLLLLQLLLMLLLSGSFLTAVFFRNNGQQQRRPLRHNSVRVRSRCLFAHVRLVLLYTFNKLIFLLIAVVLTKAVKPVLTTSRTILPLLQAV
jgi:hypothetical protein